MKANLVWARELLASCLCRCGSLGTKTGDQESLLYDWVRSGVIALKKNLD